MTKRRASFDAAVRHVLAWVDEQIEAAEGGESHAETGATAEANEGVAPALPLGARS